MWVISTSFYCCFCSVDQSCPTLCNPMDCSMPGFPALHYLPEFTQTHVHWIDDATTISSSVTLFSSYLQPFPASGSFPMSRLFVSGGQSIRASASVLPMNIQGWFPLGLTDFISLLSMGLSRVFCFLLPNDIPLCGQVSFETHCFDLPQMPWRKKCALYL